MSLDKFKNVKWDRKREFKKSLAEFNMSEEALNLIDIVSNKNVIAVTFNSLLREKHLDYREEQNSSNLIKLYTAYQVIELLDFDNKKELLKEVSEAIKKLSKKIKTTNYAKNNFEVEALKGYNISADEIIKYFSYNGYYEKVAEIFAAPFNDQQYYDFAYQLIMYINMELTFNRYTTPENTDIFLIKLEVQQKMIDTLSHITPENFNMISINLNKWFKKYNKKFIKLSHRRIEE